METPDINDAAFQYTRVHFTASRSSRLPSEPSLQGRCAERTMMLLLPWYAIATQSPPTLFFSMFQKFLNILSEEKILYLFVCLFSHTLHPDWSFPSLHSFHSPVPSAPDPHPPPITSPNPVSLQKRASFPGTSTQHVITS